MRRLLLLAALCMAAVLTLAPAALAQGGVNLEEDAGDNVDSDTGEVVGDDTPDCATPEAVLESGLCAGSASPSASATASPTASVAPCPDPDFPRETPDGCQASDLPDVEFGSASPSASASASASALPETGGAVSPAALSLVAALLLVGGGIMSASIARRK